MTNNLSAIDLAKSIIRQESRALLTLESTVGPSLSTAVDLLIACSGKVAFTGIGKSYRIGQKIAGTFTSTGTPSIFIHPAEANHGDIGMIRPNDILVALSRSGESPELRGLVLHCNAQSVPIICITARAHSFLARHSNCVLKIPDLPEACPLGLAPTTSSTMMLALGDALALACMQARGFTKVDFRQYHPGGNLGAGLQRVENLMNTGKSIPLVRIASRLSDAILEMTRCRFGCVGITDGGILAGIFTDGDLRRNLLNVELNRPISDFMTTNPVTLDPNAYIVEVINLFKERRIPSAFVCKNGRVVGIVHIHDLLQRGLL